MYKAINVRSTCLKVQLFMIIGMRAKGSCIKYDPVPLMTQSFGKNLIFCLRKFWIEPTYRGSILKLGYYVLAYFKKGC